MLRLAVIVLLFFTSFQVFAQKQKGRYRSWYQGQVISKDGDSISGVLEVNFNTDMIRVWDDSVERAFTPVNITYAKYFDRYLGRDVFLQVQYYAKNGTYKVPMFFEEYVEDSTDLYIREYEGQDVFYVRDPITGFSRSYLVDVVETEYYIRVDGGDLVHYMGGKRKLLQLLHRQQSRIKAYIKEHSLRITRKADLGLIIKYYNKLQKGNG